ncbi:N-myc-interactor [Odontesthes bonariensis]|uniref:N-myc-interactor n=1 Tax=Odontesthes bonariensis TaxID=219752 RepID=UPI003F58DED4
MDGGPEEKSLAQAKRELNAWRIKVEKADDMKARLVLEKLEEGDSKAKAQQEMMACLKKQEDCKNEFNGNMDTVKDEMQKLCHHNQDLKDKLRTYQAELEAKRAESIKLKQKFKICTQIPDTEVRFVAQSKEVREEEDGSSQPIRGVFTISQIPAVLLQGGQALLTFEEDKVASQILRTAKCSVSCDTAAVDVKPKRVTMDTAVKYEVYLDVSRKELKVLNIPAAMPEDRVKDRLEMSFSKPSRGGGEVEKVDYDGNTGTGCITFLQPGVAQHLAMRERYTIHLDSEVDVKVEPTFNFKLNKFQTFCGTTTRTIRLEDIKDVADEEDLQDHLEIHFQKPSNSGGEMESIKYISKGKALQAFFCQDVRNN